MGPKLYYRLMSYGNLLDWRCTKKVRQMMQDISNSTRQKKLDAMFCFSQPATCKESIVTTTKTFNDALSTLEIWSFAASRMKLGCISLIRDGRDPSSCTRLQNQGRIAYSTWWLGGPKILEYQASMTFSSLTNQDIFMQRHTRNCLTPCAGPHHHFLRANRDVFAWQHVNSHGPPKASNSVGN
jgi:hypothetical protein